MTPSRAGSPRRCKIADHGLTGTHHIDGSQCFGKEDSNGKVLIDCTWSATNYRSGPSYAEVMATPQMQDFIAHVMKNASSIQRDAEYVDLELEERKRRKREEMKSSLRETVMPPRPGAIKDWTVLSCGCEIPFHRDHIPNANVVVCETHGIAAIVAYK